MSDSTANSKSSTPAGGVIHVLHEAEIRAAALVACAQAYARAKVDAYSYGRGLHGEPTPEEQAELDRLQAVERNVTGKLQTEIAATENFLEDNSRFLPPAVFDLVAGMIAVAKTMQQEHTDEAFPRADELKTRRGELKKLLFG